MQQKYYNYIIIVIFILANGYLFAIKVQECSIMPLNRLNVRFDTLPNAISYKLSENKKLLSINIGNVDISNTSNTFSSNGVIQKVALRKDNDNDSVVIDIILAEPRGYTLNKQIFSRTLIIDIFDWNKLDTATEAYRLGLLSLIDNELDLARLDLVRAINGNIGDAATTLGLIQINEGKINSALNNFKFAEIKETSLNDNYAAMSQIYNIKNDSINAIHYANIYKSKTNSQNVPTINILNIIENDNFVNEKNPYIDSIILAETVPPVIDTAEVDTTRKDTVNKKLPPKDESIWEAENYLLLKYAVGIFIAMILLIVYLYLKWRNKQLLAMQQYEKEQTELQQKSTTKKKSQPTSSPKASEFNKLVDEQIKKDSKNVEHNITEKSIIQPDYKKNANTLLDIAKQRTNKDENADKIAQTNKNAIAAYNKNYNTKKSPSVELATRIAEEQKRIKSEKLSKLDNNLNVDSGKLNDIAQKLGIEKNTLEVKRNITNLTDDTNRMAELSKKLRE